MAALARGLSAARTMLSASMPWWAYTSSSPPGWPKPVTARLRAATRLAAAGLDSDHLALHCSVIDVDGTEQLVQRSRTSQLIFPVAELIARLSAIVELLPGDLIFTGTPAGVGFGRTPPEYLRAGQVVVSEIEGLGKLRQRFVVKGGVAGSGS